MECTIVNSVVLRPLPYPQSERLVFLNETRSGGDDMAVAYANFLDWRDQNDVFSGIAAHRHDNYNLTALERPERIRVSLVSAGFFQILRAKPLIGRVFLLDR